jgi:hypothetical protein
MLGAYLQGFDSLFPFDHRSMDDKLSYGSDAFPRKSMQLLLEMSNNWGPRSEKMVLGTPCRHKMRAIYNSVYFSTL